MHLLSYSPTQVVNAARTHPAHAQVPQPPPRAKGAQVLQQVAVVVAAVVHRQLQGAHVGHGVVRGRQYGTAGGTTASAGVGAAGVIHNGPQVRGGCGECNVDRVTS